MKDTTLKYKSTFSDTKVCIYILICLPWNNRKLGPHDHVLWYMLYRTLIHLTALSGISEHGTETLADTELMCENYALCVLLNEHSSYLRRVPRTSVVQVGRLPPRERRTQLMKPSTGRTSSLTSERRGFNPFAYFQMSPSQPAGHGGALSVPIHSHESPWRGQRNIFWDSPGPSTGCNSHVGFEKVLQHIAFLKPRERVSF